MHLLRQTPGFQVRRATVAELRAATSHMEPTAPIRPALLSNPMALTNWRSVAHDRLVKHMPDARLCLSTPAPADLEWGLDYLLFQQGANVLMLNGGDGTVHHTLNALFKLLDRINSEHGLELEPPRLLFVNGGGMNMVARVFETRGHPIGTIRRFLGQAAGAHLGSLRTRNTPLLKVKDADEERLGFIFGSELVHNALSLYERFGRGYRGLSLFFGALATGYMTRNETWKRFSHLIKPPDSVLEIDGVCRESYGALVATTVPMTLAQGLVKTLAKHPPRGRMNVIEVHARSPLSIIATIPFLLAGSRGPGFEYNTEARKICLNGPYTLDGELFGRNPGPLEISVSGREIEGVLC